MRYLYLDAETKSECDIRKAGGAAYVRHPTTSPLIWTWAVDNEPVQSWDESQSQAPPLSFMSMLSDPGVIKIAFNAPFDRGVITHTLGVSSPIEQWRCAMVEAYALSFKGTLDDVLTQMGFREGKDPKGKQLINLFSTPNPRNWKLRWSNHETHPEKWREFIEYGVQDTVVLRRLWQWCERYSPMRDEDWDAWFLDQRINERGMPVDLDMCRAAQQLQGDAQAAVREKLQRLTKLDNPLSNPQMRGWLDEQGLQMASLAKDVVAATDVPAHLQPILDLYLSGNSKAAAKYGRFLAMAEADARVRGAFQFNGAGRTGRWAGRGVQLHNLKRGPLTPSQPELIKLGHAGLLEAIYGDALGALAQGVRGAVCAPEGSSLVVADLASIEGRVIAWLTFCEPMLQVFRDGKDTYKDFATSVFGVSYDEVTKEQRKIAKPAVLGCFAADTEVLTEEGWKCIVDIHHLDRLWDGESWVNHKGLSFRGNQPTLTRWGVSATPNHLTLSAPDQWPEWKDLDEGHTLRCILSAAGLCSAMTVRTGCAAAIAAVWGGSTQVISPPGSPPSAETARVKLLLTLHGKNLFGWVWELLKRIGPVSPTDSTRNASDAQTPPQNLIRTMEEGVSSADSPGRRTRYGTSPPSPGGMTLWRRLTGLITTATTSRVIFDSPPEPTTATTHGLTHGWNTKGEVTQVPSFGEKWFRNMGIFPPFFGRLKRDYRQNRLSKISDIAVVPTFDVLDSGPHRRYTIRTTKGPVLVHNSGYMLGGPGLRRYADEMGIELTRKEAFHHIRTFRAKYPELPAFWQWIGDAVEHVTRTGYAIEGYRLRVDMFGEFLRIHLPSGRALHYHLPAMEMRIIPYEDEEGKVKKMRKLCFTYMGFNQHTYKWERVSAHSGGLTENCVQALALDVLRYDLELAEQAGINVVGHVHDEIICEEVTADAPRVQQELERIMSASPPWAPDLPLGAEGYTSKRYKK